MPILEHGGRWYRVTAEPVVMSMDDPDAGFVQNGQPVPQKLRVSYYFRGVWELLGSDQCGVCKTEYARKDHAIDDAIAAVFSMPSG